MGEIEATVEIIRAIYHKAISLAKTPEEIHEIEKKFKKDMTLVNKLIHAPHTARDSDYAA